MFLTMFEKTQNIMLTMHINDVFKTIEKMLESRPEDALVKLVKFSGIFFQLFEKHR